MMYNVLPTRTWVTLLAGRHVETLHIVCSHSITETGRGRLWTNEQAEIVRVAGGTEVHVDRQFTADVEAGCDAGGDALLVLREADAGDRG